MFKNKDIKLEQGDIIIIRFKNVELRYIINGEDLGTVIKIPFYYQNNFYLFIQCRNEKYYLTIKELIKYLKKLFLIIL